MQVELELYTGLQITAIVANSQTLTVTVVCYTIYSGHVFIIVNTCYMLCYKQLYYIAACSEDVNVDD